MDEPCADCTQATQEPWPVYTASCGGCVSRAVEFVPLSDKGPWISLGAGRYRSKSTDKLRYVPEEDPEWQAYMRRAGKGKA